MRLSFFENDQAAKTPGPMYHLSQAALVSGFQALRDDGRQVWLNAEYTGSKTVKQGASASSLAKKGSPMGALEILSTCDFGSWQKALHCLQPVKFSVHPH